MWMASMRRGYANCLVELSRHVGKDVTDDETWPAVGTAGMGR